MAYVALRAVLEDIEQERYHQNEKWGEQTHADGTGEHFIHPEAVTAMRNEVERAFAEERGTWRHILSEEIAEAFSESSPERLREELVQVAAVAAAWIEDIDRRPA